MVGLLGRISTLIGISHLEPKRTRASRKRANVLVVVTSFCCVELLDIVERTIVGLEKIRETVGRARNMDELRYKQRRNRSDINRLLSKCAARFASPRIEMTLCAWSADTTGASVADRRNHGIAAYHTR